MSDSQRDKIKRRVKTALKNMEKANKKLYEVYTFFEDTDYPQKDAIEKLIAMQKTVIKQLKAVDKKT